MDARDAGVGPHFSNKRPRRSGVFWLEGAGNLLLHMYLTPYVHPRPSQARISYHFWRRHCQCGFRVPRHLAVRTNIVIRCPYIYTSNPPQAFTLLTWRVHVPICPTLMLQVNIYKPCAGQRISYRNIWTFWVKFVLASLELGRLAGQSRVGSAEEHGVRGAQALMFRICRISKNQGANVDPKE